MVINHTSLDDNFVSAKIYLCVHWHTCQLTFPSKEAGSKYLKRPSVLAIEYRSDDVNRRLFWISAF